MRIMGILALVLLVALAVAAQDAEKVVFVPAKQIEAEIHKAPANSIGESEIDLIEHTPGHAAISAASHCTGQSRGA